MKLLFLNGVNLGLTGMREKGVYGSQTFEEINAEIRSHFKDDECEFFQSDIEGEICKKIHEAVCDGIILNAGAYTHYSIAIRDAISSVTTPVVEVHMSNVHSREDFRHVSVLSSVCKGVILGFGKNSYILAGESFKL